MTPLEKLNPKQRSAAESVEGPLLVLAGAGSGKTRVVTFRIAHLLELGVPASQILGLTFTNKAALEMKERVHELTQSNVLICTFHSLGARILRESIHLLGYRSNFTIYDEADIEKLLKTCVNHATLTKQELNEMRSRISSVKNGQLSITALDPFASSIFDSYQAKLLEYNAVDYDDLLGLPVRLFEEHPEILKYYQARWSFFLIDEYQDTNNIQYTLVKQLVGSKQNLCAVGDPDQSIYSWRGANIQNILNFEKDFPGAQVVRLEQNYRSRSNILDAANALISQNKGRYEKKLWSDRGPGDKIRLYRSDDDRTEASFIANRIDYHQREHQIPLNEMVVFYRTNAQSRALEDCLLHHQIPYIIVGGISFYQRREIKDILAWLRILQSGNDWASFMRTINLPKRGLGDTTIEKIQVCASQQGMAIFDFCEQLTLKSPSELPLKLTSRQTNGLKEYVQIVRSLREASQHVSLAELIQQVIELSRYREYLEEEKETMGDRLENLNALVTKAIEWNEQTAAESLTSFLEEISLKSSLDDADNTRERVNLMTIHNGKGLEFEVTFLAGMEEDLFPHANSRESHDSLEEERRLCYVGMTRAKEYLYVTYASVRLLWGALRQQKASRFISEIPREFIEKVFGPSSNKSPISEKYSQKVTAISDILNSGDLVFHQEYGVGRIEQAYEGQAGLTYRVFFSKGQMEKTLVAQYAPLTKL